MKRRRDFISRSEVIRDNGLILAYFISGEKKEWRFLRKEEEASLAFRYLLERQLSQLYKRERARNTQHEVLKQHFILLYTKLKQPESST